MNKKPITYFIIIVFIYTVYDYFEHITRINSIFKNEPWDWMLFSLSAFVSLILFTLLIKTILEKVLKRKTLLIELSAFIIWISIYLSFLGPLFDNWFWPHEELIFKSSTLPILIFSFVFFIVRIGINLIMKKKIFYSE